MSQDLAARLKLYVVTDPRYDFRRWLNAVLDAGVTAVQIRDKTASDAEVARDVELALQQAERYDALVFVNDRVEVAQSTGAHGVHLGRSDEPVTRARSRLGSKVQIGWSMETTDERALEEEHRVDYVAASPVFATPSKTDTEPAWQLEGLAAIRRRTRLPLVAIGGIGPDNVQEVLRSGADGVAVISSVWGQADPARAARRLRRLIDEVDSSRDRPEPLLGRS